MKLHIGGLTAKAGWKILNIQPGEHVDFLGDISSLDQFAAESCDQVYASHVLEHVHQRQVLPTLQGLRRILKPGGQLLVSVPDWDILCHLFLNPLASLDVKWKTMRMIMGGQIDEHDFHYVGLNQAILYDLLNKAGFSNASRVESFGLFQDTSDYKPYGFPVSLNVVATR